MCIASACVAPDATTGGGDRFDAAPPSVTNDGGIEGGSTWAELYRDYFGPTGHASCAGDGSCHGADGQPGAKASGYVCGHDINTCYAGITNPRTQLVKASDRANPKKSFLHGILRKREGGGIMPLRPNFVFQPLDMDRIDAWIENGAPNDSPQ